jgi:hypothetical protein
LPSNWAHQERAVSSLNFTWDPFWSVPRAQACWDILQEITIKLREDRYSRNYGRKEVINLKQASAKYSMYKARNRRKYKKKNIRQTVQRHADTAERQKKGIRSKRSFARYSREHEKKVITNLEQVFY